MIDEVVISKNEYERLKECEEVCNRIKFLSGMDAKDICWKSFEYVNGKSTMYNDFVIFGGTTLKDEYKHRVVEKNYFPNHLCGECPISLALDHYEEHFSDKYENVNEFIYKHCRDCNLYKKEVKQIATNMNYELDNGKVVKYNLLTYKNIFIEDVMDGRDSFYKIRNRDKKYIDLLEVCDKIDGEILAK